MASDRGRSTGRARRKSAGALLALAALTTAGGGVGDPAHASRRSPTATAAPSPDAPPPAGSMLMWSDADKLRWFKATERVMPSNRVRHGPYVRPLPSAGRTIDPKWTYKGGEWDIARYMREYRVSGLIVLRDGKVLLERYALGRTARDRWTSFSVAKSVTSLLAGAAIRDGRLGLTDTVAQYLPEMRGSAYGDVTVRNLLMMASGVEWYEDYADPKSDIIRLTFDQSQSRDPLLAYLAAKPRVSPAGTRFHYNSAETHLAGRVIAKAVGMSLSDYLSRKIWKPYGMEDDAYWLLDRGGKEQAGCCLAMRLRDFARVGQFALENGVARGTAVLPTGWIAESTRVQIPNGLPAPAGYGYFWWIGARAYEASGIFGQSILVYPKERIVIAMNSAWPIAESDELFAALSRMHGAVHDAAAPDFPPTMRP